MRPLTRLADRWPNVPLAGGLLALMLLVAGVLVIFQSAGNYVVLKRQETQVQARILAASVTAALDFGDSATAQESVRAFGVNPQVSAAGVYEARGRLFAGFSRTRAALPAMLGRLTRHGGNTLEATAPVMRGGERIGTVYLEVEREPISRRIARYSVIGLLVVMASLVVLILGVAHTALRRANHELEARARDLGLAYGELQIQVEERGRAEEQLRQAQKMQALGQLTGGIAHDFNNLLTVIQGSADMLARPGLDERKRIRFAEAIVQTAARAATLTSQLLAFARRQPLKPQVLDLNRMIGGMIELIDRTLGETIRVLTDLAPGLCAVEADPAQLEAALLNIAVNARDAMPDGGTLTIATHEAAPLEDGRPAIAVSVADTGSGIAPEVLQRVFEPFFTTKSVGKGTGLGLSQVYGFAAQTGGDVQVTSEPGTGTTVTMILPCSDGAAGGHADAGGAATAAARTGRLLVVDDNEEVGALAAALCAELGHEVARARSGAEALGMVEDGRFDLVFTDVVMPGMTGLELAERLRETMPGLPIVLTTGFSDEIGRVGDGGLPILYKPYRADTLRETLARALAGSPAGGE
ncbi:MAG TPA: ATP-binding protein [Allosphingosinicella sp.]|jgi:signal transduction histidine kinase/CheY-like chemotaxis protein